MEPPWTPALKAGLRGAARAVELRIPGRLWRLRDDGGGLWLKRLASSRGFDAERHVLRAGLPGAPALRAADPAVGALLMEELPGEDVESIEVTEIQRAAHRGAGRWLARLHALPVDEEDRLSIEGALSARLSAAVARLGPRAQGLPVLEIRAALEGLHLPGARRVWCHRDFEPRNWRWDGRALQVLDFEHARPDLWLVDLAKLATDAWVGQPALRGAFFEGYGRPLEPAEREALRALEGLHGLVTLGWGLRHEAPAFVSLGEGILGRWR